MARLHVNARLTANAIPVAMCHRYNGEQQKDLRRHQRAGCLHRCIWSAAEPSPNCDVDFVTAMCADVVGCMYCLDSASAKNAAQRVTVRKSVRDTTMF